MLPFKTVLGNISESDLGVTLVHEHICCFSAYAYQMAGKDYLDKKALADTATVYLKELKKKYPDKEWKELDGTPEVIEINKRYNIRGTLVSNVWRLKLYFDE